MMNNPKNKFVWLFLIILCLLVDSCSFAPIADETQTRFQLVIAVWDGPAAKRIKQSGAVFTHTTGIPVLVETYPEWQYYNLIEARLLAGTSPWDVLYLKGEWVPQLSIDNALADLNTLVGPELKNWSTISELRRGEALVGLQVDGNLPFLFYRRDQITSEMLSKVNTADELLGMLGELSLPVGEYASGAALGEQNALLEAVPYWPLNAYSQLITMAPPNKIDHLKTILSTFCNLKNQKIFTPPSSNWGEGDLAAALKDGKIAAAVLWSDSGPELLNCTKDSLSCKNGESLIGFHALTTLVRKEDGGIPRLMGAWTVPGQEVHRKAAAAWLRWVISPQGEKTWQDLGGIPLGNEKVVPGPTQTSITESVKTIFFDAYLATGMPDSESLQINFNQYFHECINGKISPDEFIQKFKLDQSEFLKKSGFKP